MINNMLYPSIDSLLTKIDSKYSLVSVAAKRARSMQESGEGTRIAKPVSHKYVGKALEEIHSGDLTYRVETGGRQDI